MCGRCVYICRERSILSICVFVCVCVCRCVFVCVCPLSYLSRHGILTQQGLVVDGEDGRVVVDVQHGDQGNAFTYLGGILWNIDTDIESEIERET